MKAFLDPTKETPVPLSTQLKVTVELQLCKVLNKNPDDAISPDKTDVRPGYRRHKKTESHDQNGYDLRSENGQEENTIRMRFGEHPTPGSNHKQCKVTGHGQFEIDKRLELGAAQIQQ